MMPITPTRVSMTVQVDKVSFTGGTETGRRIIELSAANMKKLSLETYNSTGNEALKEAQKRPEEYRDLIVRTGGYSALFVELDKTTQDDIISRAEHQF